MRNSPGTTSLAYRLLLTRGEDAKVPTGRPSAPWHNAVLTTRRERDDAIAQVQRLWDQSDGGFGTFLVMGTDWADTEPTRRSYELLARYVFPAFQGSAESTTSSRDWAAENRPTFIGEVGAAIMTAIGKHNAEHDSDPATGGASAPVAGS